jgi:hypothetical protein
VAVLEMAAQQLLPSAVCIALLFSLLLDLLLIAGIQVKLASFSPNLVGGSCN